VKGTPPKEKKTVESLEAKWKTLVKRKLPYAMFCATFTYFGTIFAAFFGCILLPTILFGRLYLVPNQPIMDIDFILLSPYGVVLKLLFAALIALLPALSYGRGFLLSAALMTFPGVVTYHYALVAVGLENLGTEAANFSPLTSPFGLLDGLLVFIPAMTLGTLYTLLLQETDYDRISSRGLIVKPVLPILLVALLIGAVWLS